MIKTYQILLDMNVEDLEDRITIKEAIYSYLEELIEDDSLYYEEIDNETTWEYLLVINWNSSNDATIDTHTRIWRILWLKHTYTTWRKHTNQY